MSEWLPSPRERDELRRPADHHGESYTGSFLRGLLGCAYVALALTGLGLLLLAAWV